METGNSFAAGVLRQSRDTRQLKRAHAAILVRGLPFPAWSPGRLRHAFSHAALSPSGDLRYGFLLLLSLQFRSSSPKAAAAFRFLCNTAIRGLARRSRSPEALPQAYFVFRRMIRAGSPPSRFTFTFLIQACSVCGASLGYQLHGAVVKNSFLDGDVCVRNSLIRFYSECDAASKANNLFLEGTAAGQIDAVSWNSMIDCYLNNGYIPSALLLFDRMPQKNTITWNTAIAGLIKNERLDAARCLFDEMSDKNVVSWTSIISGYAHRGDPEEALSLFQEFLICHRNLNNAILLSALAAASQTSLSHGLWLHASVKRRHIQIEPSLSTAIISMYGNFGRVDLALQVFHRLKPSEKDLSTYTAAIFALGTNNHGNEALFLFESLRTLGFEPDRVAYLAILFTCSHMGWNERGFFYFESMKEDGIPAELDHYAAMVDMLGRGGLLKEAEDFIASMPLKPDKAIWGALLNACRIHGNSDVGKRVGEFMIDFDGGHDGTYVLLSNIFAESKNRGIAEQVRKMMTTRKMPGISTIEVNCDTFI